MDDFHRGLITQVHCYECNALYDRIACPVCGHVIEAEKVRQPDGSYVERRTVPGALGWSTHLLLEMMRREWERADDDPAPMGKTSPKLLLGILDCLEQLPELGRAGLADQLVEGSARCLVWDIIKGIRTVGCRRGGVDLIGRRNILEWALFLDRLLPHCSVEA